MKFKVGDKVAVLDDDIKGVVNKIEGNNVTIISEDDFELNFTASDLVLIGIEQSELAKRTVLPGYLSEKIDYVKRPKKGIKLKKKQESFHVMEVDLHIEKLVKSTKGMDNYDKLSLQIDTAKHKLEFAIRNRIPRIVFIHGVGQGVLKSELNFLFGRYPVRTSEASYQKYGMGATEVYILQNTTNL